MTSNRIPRLNVGSQIGGYLTVLGIVYDFGPDPVYIVWHHGSWCPMACKVFRKPEQAQREVAVLRALAHPNIVRPFGYGDPAHVLMEYLEGPTLRRLIKSLPRKRLSISDALRVAIHLGGALAHMHDRGFLHLDVKPRNVIISRARPVLFDFGTARPQCDWEQDLLEGTDPYMAPEQCRREAVSPATDIYALGVTLFEMLTGGRPFPDGSRRKTFPQLTQDPRPLRALRRSVSPALEGLVLECLSREPYTRPAVKELLPKLHSHIRGGAPLWPRSFEPPVEPDRVRFPPPAPGQEAAESSCYRGAACP
ncbi:MAG: serine/threonine protein kinase [Methyloceanibacter sp.]